MQGRNVTHADSKPCSAVQHPDHSIANSLAVAATTVTSMYEPRRREH